MRMLLDAGVDATGGGVGCTPFSFMPVGFTPGGCTPLHAAASGPYTLHPAPCTLHPTAARRCVRSCNRAILYAMSFNLKYFWQSSLLHDLFDITSEDHAV